jgi:hypothetical protein
VKEFRVPRPKKEYVVEHLRDTVEARLRVGFREAAIRMGVLNPRILIQQNHAFMPFPLFIHHHHSHDWIAELMVRDCVQAHGPFFNYTEVSVVPFMTTTVSASGQARMHPHTDICLHQLVVHNLSAKSDIS